ncbi:hypothetical protein Hanom_Chr07g00586461 [Helianthus anomalus]
MIEFVVELSSVKVAKERRKFTGQIYSTLVLSLFLILFILIDMVDVLIFF